MKTFHNPRLALGEHQETVLCKKAECILYKPEELYANATIDICPANLANVEPSKCFTYGCNNEVFGEFNNCEKCL